MDGCPAPPAGPTPTATSESVALPTGDAGGSGGGAGGSASSKEKRQAQLIGFSKKSADAPAAPAPPAAAALTHADKAKKARQLLHAAALQKGSPEKIRIGWLPEEENIKARVRGTKEVVEVFNPPPPLTYYQRPNGRMKAPNQHLRVIMLKFMHILKDGAARFARGEGDMLCGHCFSIVRMPKFGEENLRAHLCSAVCGASDWAKPLAGALAAERPTDRRRVQVASDGTIIDAVTKMTWNIETAMMFTEIGTLPAALFDHPKFVSWVGTITRGAYLPPCAKWLSPEEGPIIDLAFDATVALMTALIDAGRRFYKGIGFMHLTFDCWTSRCGFPFLGADFTFNAPWLLTRENMHCDFVGQIRQLLTAPLYHLTGSHNGARIALAIAAICLNFGIEAERITLAEDDYDAHTDVSAMIKSACTDSGGGVPAACRRLGRKHKKCGLHGCDSVLGRIAGLAWADSTLPADLALAKALFK